MTGRKEAFEQGEPIIADVRDPSPGVTDPGYIPILALSSINPFSGFVFFVCLVVNLGPHIFLLHSSFCIPSFAGPHAPGHPRTSRPPREAIRPGFRAFGLAMMSED